MKTMEEFELAFRYGAGQSLVDSYRDALAELTRRDAVIREQEKLFKDHTAAVARFLDELYMVMVDPLAEGTRTVAETKKELMAAALRERERDEQIRLLQDAHKWRPIETAPKDGTPILAYWPIMQIYKVRVGSWQRASHGPGYWAAWNGGVKFSQRNPPTHWQPLPEPPK